MLNGNMKNSRELKDRARKVWAQGHCATNSKRWTAYVEGPTPCFVERGQGPYVWDVDGNKYLDFVGSLGANILGYCHPKVDEAVVAQVKKGASFSLPHRLEVEVAEMIREMVPCAEKVRFAKNGRDATDAAVRIARTFTMAPGIASEGYHGCSDLWTSLTKPGLGVVDNFEISSFDVMKVDDPSQYPDHCEYAATIVEPIGLDASKERQEALSALSWSNGTANDLTDEIELLIFDEIITGMRVPKYTVAKWWDIKPDLICLGKGIANGYPLSVVGGRADVMDCGEYFISTTFGGEAVSLAACKATLQELQKLNVEDLYYYANRFQNSLNAACKEIGVEFKGYGTRAMLNVDEPNGRCLNGQALFMQECLKVGILFGKAFFYGFQHLEAGIEEQTLNVVGDVVGKIRRGEVKLEGNLPASTFKR